MAKYKIGDKVEVIRDCEEIIKPGSIGEIVDIDNSYPLTYRVKLDESCFLSQEEADDNEGDGLNFYEEEIKLKGEKAPKPKKVNFLLNYNIADDYTEEYETMKEVDNRIKELTEAYQGEVDEKTFTIYEVKKKYNVKVKVNTVISKKVA